MSFRVNRTRSFVILVIVILVATALAGGWIWLSRSAAHTTSSPAAHTTVSPAGPKVKSSVGPNAKLPAVKAGSQGCAAMDGVLSKLLAGTPQGKTFTQRVAQIQAQQADMNQETVNANPEWAKFLQILPKHYADFEAAAGNDAAANRAVANLHTIVSIEPQLISGKIPEYKDPEAAQRLIKAGKTPQQNPEYVKRFSELDKALDQVTWCMPTWPVIFG